MWAAFVAVLSAILKFLGLKRAEVAAQAQKVEQALKAGEAIGVAKAGKAQEKVILDHKTKLAKGEIERIFREKP